MKASIKMFGACLILLMPLLLTRAFENRTLAAEYHKVGVDAGMSGRYQMSLAYLRTAARHDTTDLMILNDLGVTEMRIGQLQRAKRRFLQILESRPDYDIAIENLNEIRKYMSEEDFKLGTSKEYPAKHERKLIPEISAETLRSIRTFHPEFRKLQRSQLSVPFVVKRAAQLWGWDLNRLRLERIARLYGGERADFYPHNMYEERVKPIITVLGEAIDTLSKGFKMVYEGIDVSQAGTYIQWNMNPRIWDELISEVGGKGAANMPSGLPDMLDDSSWGKQCLDDSLWKLFHKNTHWKMMLIGEAGSGMFNHKDTLKTSSFQIQIQGRKKWHICAPSQDPYMYAAGDIDAFKPDYQRFPKFSNASCFEQITEPGDLIYYPKEYWHQTLNLDTPTVSLTGRHLQFHSISNRRRHI
jgi:hypothetical protein